MDDNRDPRDSEDIIDLLDVLEETVRQARGVLLSDSCIVSRNGVLELLARIRENFPGELQTAKWVVENQHRVVEKARSEAQWIINDAEERAVGMMREHEIYQQAQQEAEAMIRNAEARVEQLYADAQDYINEKLTFAGDSLTGIVLDLRRIRDELQAGQSRGPDA